MWGFSDFFFSSGKGKCLSFIFNATRLSQCVCLGIIVRGCRLKGGGIFSVEITHWQNPNNLLFSISKPISGEIFTILLGTHSTTHYIRRSKKITRYLNNHPQYNKRSLPFFFPACPPRSCRGISPSLRQRAPPRHSSTPVEEEAAEPGWETLYALNR